MGRVLAQDNTQEQGERRQRCVIYHLRMTEGTAGPIYSHLPVIATPASPDTPARHPSMYHQSPVNQLSICRQSQSTFGLSAARPSQPSVYQPPVPVNHLPTSRQSQSTICLPATSPSQSSVYQPPVPVNHLSTSSQSQSTVCLPAASSGHPSISCQSQSIICLSPASPSQTSVYHPPVPANLLSPASPSQPSVYHPPAPVNHLSMCRQPQSTICLCAASPSQSSVYVPPVPVNHLSMCRQSQSIICLCVASPSLPLLTCHALLLLPRPRSVPTLSTTPCGSGLSAFPSRCRPSPASAGQLVSPLPAAPAHGSLRTPC